MQPVEDTRPLNLIPYETPYTDGTDPIFGWLNFPRPWEGCIIQDDEWYQTHHPGSR